MESDGPKALVSLGEKPFLSHVLDMLDELPLEYPPVVVVGHQKEKVIEAIGPRYVYAEQTEQLGTGHAVLSAKKHTHPDHGTVFVSYTDQPFITKETVEKLVSTQQETGAVICMAKATCISSPLFLKIVPISNIFISFIPKSGIFN
jgi:bifunctional UDP-N-acetylglucosamine pyrophosphorylase/glucosamine-1-phosphate N-acetyltransferase